MSSSQQTQPQSQPSLSPSRLVSSRLSPKLSKTAHKSASLDHEIFLNHRKNNAASTISDWKLLHPSTAHYATANNNSNLVTNNLTTTQSQCNMTRAISSSSLASSTRTASHYQEYKAEIINQTAKTSNFSEIEKEAFLTQDTRTGSRIRVMHAYRTIYRGSTLKIFEQKNS